jgi:hypothetical protein
MMAVAVGGVLGFRLTGEDEYALVFGPGMPSFGLSSNHYQF